LVNVNLLAKELRCPRCGGDHVTPYDDPALRESIGVEQVWSVASWDMSQQLGRELELTNERYRCPQCGAMSLRFEMCALWD
jgi:hypothetical protein